MVEGSTLLRCRTACGTGGSNPLTSAIFKSPSKYGITMAKRCFWAKLNNSLMVEYHDKEWGVPAHNDKYLFEKLLLDSAQAGLSWECILNKRENYRKAYSNFNYKKVAKYTEKDIQRLLNDPGIVRNKLKIRSSIENAKFFIEIQKEFSSFDQYLWSFVNHRTIQNKIKEHRLLPAFSEESTRLSKDLKKRGFKFVGPTIVYAFMQAVGLVNDHTTDCFRYKEIKRLSS